MLSWSAITGMRSTQGSPGYQLSSIADVAIAHTLPSQNEPVGGWTGCGVNLLGGGADVCASGAVLEWPLQKRARDHGTNTEAVQPQAERLVIVARACVLFPPQDTIVQLGQSSRRCRLRSSDGHGLGKKGCGVCPEAERQDHATRWWTWPDARLWPASRVAPPATCADCRRRIKHARKSMLPPNPAPAQWPWMLA